MGTEHRVEARETHLPWVHLGALDSNPAGDEGVPTRGEEGRHSEPSF